MADQDEEGLYNFAVIADNDETQQIVSFDASAIFNTQSTAVDKAMNVLRQITDYGSEVKTTNEECNMVLDAFPDWLCVEKIILADASSMLFPKGVTALILHKNTLVKPAQ